jgi:alpha-tubulin suppressor-like RCC1 family protein
VLAFHLGKWTSRHAWAWLQCFVLANDRQVLVWGSGNFGQIRLDSEETKGFLVHARALEDMVPCKVLCGRWTSAVITDSEIGVLLMWGKNTHGQLGIGKKKVSRNIR